MLDTPEIIETESQPLAAIHLTIPRAKIREVMGPGLQELRAEVERQGVAITGPWLTHHLRITSDAFDFEICLPVDKPVVAHGRVQPSTRPAMRAVHATLRGGYEQLGEAWGSVLSWMEGAGVKGAPDLWEVYAVGPEVGPEASLYRTELYKPLLAVA